MIFFLAVASVGFVMAGITCVLLVVTPIACVICVLEMRDGFCRMLTLVDLVRMLPFLTLFSLAVSLVLQGGAEVWMMPLCASVAWVFLFLGMSFLVAHMLGLPQRRLLVIVFIRTMIPLSCHCVASVDIAGVFVVVFAIPLVFSRFLAVPKLPPHIDFIHTATLLISS